MSFTIQVHAVIAQHLERECTINIVANHFRVSTRTLIRRLENERSSYRVILEYTRKEVALALLLDPLKSVADVALALGYQDASNFGRAFRGWFAVSPDVFRNLAKDDRLVKRQSGEKS